MYWKNHTCFLWRLFGFIKHDKTLFWGLDPTVFWRLFGFPQIFSKTILMYMSLFGLGFINCLQKHQTCWYENSHWNCDKFRWNRSWSSAEKRNSGNGWHGWSLEFGWVAFVTKSFEDPIKTVDDMDLSIYDSTKITKIISYNACTYQYPLRSREDSMIWV